MQVANFFSKIFLSPRRSKCCKWQLGFVYSIHCKWLTQMQGFARTLPYEHTLHSLQVLVNYYYRAKKQRLRKIALCLYVGHTRGLVSSSTTLLPLTSSNSSGGLKPCPDRTLAFWTFADSKRTFADSERHLQICKDICWRMRHLPILSCK